MEREVRHRDDFKAIIGVFFLILIVLMFFLSLKNGAPIANIMAGILPTIVYLAVLFELLYHTRHKRFLVWILPLILVILFYVIAQMFQAPLIAEMDIPTLAFFNLLLCYIFAAVILFAVYVQGKGTRQGSYQSAHAAHYTQARHAPFHHALQPQQAIHPQHASHAQPSLNPLPQPSLKESIHSLEDKCKAINYAIGRVYSDKHGGSKDLRERISVNKDWYNKFSSLVEISEKDKELIRISVDLIQKRLSLLDHKEKDVFLGSHDKLVRILRNPDGKDTIGQVLVRNDKDPVETYIKNAKQACQDILANL